MLVDNPFAEAITTAELLDEEGLVASLVSLLTDKKSREMVISRQREYCAVVRALPSAWEVLDQQLEN